jgi:hypothetical protein
MMHCVNATGTKDWHQPEAGRSRGCHAAGAHTLAKLWQAEEESRKQPRATIKAVAVSLQSQGAGQNNSTTMRAMKTIIERINFRNMPHSAICELVRQPNGRLSLKWPWCLTRM